MTGIPTVNKVQLVYEILVIGCTAGFAVYDTARRRVPDRGLALFCPLVLSAPLFHALPCHALGNLLPALVFSLAGAAAGFFPLLLAALLSGDGAGVGGGDIKLAGLLGFALGPARILSSLFPASLLTGAAALILQGWRKRQPAPHSAGQTYRQEKLALPFVPFLFVGILAATAAQVITN